MRYVLPPMHTLKTFECVARLHSFTAAAEELHLTISAVSHQIRAIETFYAAKLLRRGAREVTLTQAGEALRDVVVTFLGQLSEVGKALRSISFHRCGFVTPGLGEARLCGRSFVRSRRADRNTNRVTSRQSTVSMNAIVLP